MDGCVAVAVAEAEAVAVAVAEAVAVAVHSLSAQLALVWGHLGGSGAPWRRSWTPSACQGLSSTAPAHKIKPQGIRPMVATVAMVALVPTKWGQGVPFRPPLPRAGGQDDVSSQANSLKPLCREVLFPRTGHLGGITRAHILKWTYPNT